jgi:N-acetylglucosamine-6-phosphate deacetylase
MAQLLLYNSRVILKDGIKPGGVLIRDRRIALVFTRDQTPVGLSSSDSVDLSGAYLAPGFIDIHIHGSVGVDVQDTDAVGLKKLSDFLIAEGVTGYFPTFVPANENVYREAATTIELFMRQQRKDELGKRPLTSRVMGIHFEGPFVSKNRCGALQTEHFRIYEGDPKSLTLFLGRSTMDRRLMTLAPEITGATELVNELARNGVRPFIGHSQADHESLDRAFAFGARHITHFPNALDPLHHRKPGAVAWGLLRDDVTVDCIADFHHLHQDMLRLLYKSKTTHRMALISDAIKPAGLGDGEFLVWGEPILVRNGRTALARKADESTIAGSVITMRQATKNMAEIGVPLHHAVYMATAVPARVAGLEGFGSIEEGVLGDLVSFDDDFEIRSTFIGGVPAYKKDLETNT